MSLRTYLTRIRRLDAMIRRKSTGPPEKLAAKLDISERWLYKFLREIREELDCPIAYDHYKQSYVYKKRGKLVLEFNENLNQKEKQSVSGGEMIKPNSLYLLVQ